MAELRLKLRFRMVAALLAVELLVLLFASSAGAPRALGAAGTADEGWTSNTTFTVNFLGRDGPRDTDHYRVTFSWGATFYGTAVDALPLLPADKSVGLLTDGYRATFPSRRLEDIQPDDSFDFYVPAGTLVADQWRNQGQAREFKSLQGDVLVMYTSLNSPIQYRLRTAADPNRVQVMLSPNADLKPLQLAQLLYGQDDPNFQPDFLQVAKAKDMIDNHTLSVTVDSTQKHMDDFWDLRGSGQADGKSDAGLDVFWFRDSGTTQPLFRVDDGIGGRTDPTTFTSPMRIYYYKDGVVRTYVRADDTTFLSGRQASNDAWARAYSDFGGVSPAPARWGLGQPEQDAAAQEMNKLGIAVLRFQPKVAPPGNLITQLLDWVFSLMKRKQS